MRGGAGDGGPSMVTVPVSSSLNVSVHLYLLFRRIKLASYVAR